MARAWLIDGRAFAKKLKDCSGASAHLVKDFGANLHCPNCRHVIDNRDLSIDWPGIPAGLKFDPSDGELLEHLAAKCGVGNLKPHAYIDEFIPTLDGDEGICYTHPENLPGAKKDGRNVHFFHKTTNAYGIGQRKRRKVQSQCSSTTEHVRWHKTGKTKHVIENGVHRGCKKIMVLYKISCKGSKPEKSNWVMHQYHLGTDEDEKEGEYVVSKIFYRQQNPVEENTTIQVIDQNNMIIQTSPETPRTSPPNPPRPLDDMSPISAQEPKVITEESRAASGIQLGDDRRCGHLLAGESRAAEDTELNRTRELHKLHDSSSCNASNTNDATLDSNIPYGLANLESLELYIQSDFSDVKLGPQESISGWLGRF